MLVSGDSKAEAVPTRKPCRTAYESSSVKTQRLLKCFACLTTNTHNGIAPNPIPRLHAPSFSSTPNATATTHNQNN